MKLLILFLLATGSVQAAEVLPLSGKPSIHVQKALDAVLPQAASELGDVTVEPVLEGLKLSGGGKRLLLGPMAGSSFVVLRIRITDGERVTERVFTETAGAWRGTFQPRIDSAMLDRLANHAAQFVRDYR